ncbi:MAG: transcriptional repressor [Phycisphaeraceae bacterium]|nr:transcriptional repressor [Phycisphaeraceae bacterium]MCW5763586.1 transcriptional repressor [Phycisphaeraceae bacterium]
MARMTRQRAAIEEAFAHAARPLSPQEVLAAASREIADLGLSTVYRTLRRLEEEGLIVPVDVPGEPPRYELKEAAAHHHHHFHCDSCGKVYDIHGCPSGLAGLLPPGFVLSGHTIVLHGRCAACA